MPRFFVLILNLLFSFSLFASSEICRELDRELNDMQILQGRFAAPGDPPVSEHVKQMQEIQETLALFENLHTEMMKTPGSFHIEKFASEEQMDNPQFRKKLSRISAQCTSLESQDQKDECSQALLVYQDKTKYVTAKEQLNGIHTKLFESLQTAYIEPEFQKMSSISRYLASKKLKQCPEETEANPGSTLIDGQCPALKIPSQLDTLAINSSEVVFYYFNNSQVNSEADLIKSCEYLLNKGYSPLACSGIACQKGHDLVMGNCLAKCTNLEIRSSKAPYACFPDEQAQIAKNQRIEKSKKSWGRVLRTGSIIAISGGVIAGTAYLLHETYKDRSLITTNNNTYYNYEYNTNRYYKTGTTVTTPNTPYYNYNPNSLYNPYAQMSYPTYNFGYDPYNSGYGYNYGNFTSPYGTGLGSGAWGGGFGF